MDRRAVSFGGQPPGRRHSTGGAGTGTQGRRAAPRRFTADSPHPSARHNLSQQDREDIRRFHYTLQQAQAAAEYLREYENVRAREAGRPPVPLPQMEPLNEDALLAALQQHATYRPRPANAQLALDRAARRAGGQRQQTPDASRMHANEGRVRRTVRRILAFFGYGTGNRQRRELVSLVWTFCFGFVQVRWLFVHYVKR